MELPLPFVDRSRREITNMIRRKTETVRGVKDVRQVNVRISGKRLDVSLLVALDESEVAEDPHRISLKIEREILSEFPNARVAISTEPSENGQQDLWKLVKQIAEGTPGSRGVHNIHVQKVGKTLCVDLHLEVSANLTVKQAHDVADDVEKRVREASPTLGDITVHIESASERVSRELAGVETELEPFIQHVAESLPEIKSVSGIRVRRLGDVLHLVLQCQFSPNLSIAKAHEVSNRLEKEIKTTFPRIVRIDIHEEPA